MKVFLVNLIIFFIIFNWFSLEPTCSITALEITKSDLKIFTSSSLNSDDIDFVKLLEKKLELIFWLEIDLKILTFFKFFIIILLLSFPSSSVVPISNASYISSFSNLFFITFKISNLFFLLFCRKTSCDQTNIWD